MASVSLLGTATWNTTSGTKTVTATPAVGDLIILITGHSGSNVTTAPTDDQGGTYTQLDFATKASAGDRLTAWARDSLISSAVSTIFTHAPGTTTGGGLAVVKVTGMSKVSAAAKLQSAVINQVGANAGTTPTPVLGATPQSGNPVIGAVFNAVNPAGMTPRTGYTELTDVGYTTPAAGLEVMSLNSGETSATIAWGGTSSAAYCALAVELDASASGTTYNDTLSESVTSAANLANAATFGPTLSESVAAADTQASLGTFGVPYSEAVTAAATLSTTATFPNALSESLTAASSFTGGLLFSLSISEGLTASAAVAAAVTFSPALSEAITAAYSLANAAALVGSITASVTASDSAAVSATLAASLSESVSAADSSGAIAQFANLLSETLISGVALADSLSAPATVYNNTLSETITAGASFAARTMFERDALPAALEIASLAQPPAISITAQAAIGAVGISAGTAAGALSITDEPEPADLVWN
jgi:hypothetical protein